MLLNARRSAQNEIFSFILWGWRFWQWRCRACRPWTSHILPPLPHPTLASTASLLRYFYERFSQCKNTNAWYACWWETNVIAISTIQLVYQLFAQHDMQYKLIERIISHFVKTVLMAVTLTDAILRNLFEYNN